jgi:hypothetical protein
MSGKWSGNYLDTASVKEVKDLRLLIFLINQGKTLMSSLRIAACTTVAALIALAVASTAWAAPVVTYPTGTVLSTSTNVKGTNSGEVTMTTAFGTATCSKASLTGTLDSNTTAGGSKITVNTASFSGTGPNGECTSWTGGFTMTPGVAGGLPWCIEATTPSDEGKLRGGKCGELSRGIAISLDFTSIGTCTYNRSTAASGSIRTDDGSRAAITLSNQEWTGVGNPVLCPSSFKLNVTFELALASNGDPIYFSS